VNPTRRGAAGRRLAGLAAFALAACLALPSASRAEDSAAAAPVPVRVVTDAAGSRLQVGGQDFMVHGMNWDYIPIGQNYMYDLFSQPDDVIVAALDREMGLLKSMHVNALRIYAGIPPKWVQYIYERYGIWTVINHPVGRYGFTMDGVWYPVTDYSDPKMRAALKADVMASIERYRGTPGVLMWLLGNENNYGLSWKSFEIEALPKGERDAARARKLYSLFGELITSIHAADGAHPVAMANGDIQYLDLIAEECKGLDVFGTNVYRGISVGDLFQRVKDKMGIPVVFSEFGCDAFNAKTEQEDQAMQAKFLTGQWREIYEQSAGKGRVGNAIGGFVFQWSDGWWKYGQESRLDVHDTHASWPDGGFTDDFVQGENNMNEEWWGVCAKGPADTRGLYELYPRAAFYALQKAFALAPYAPSTDLAAIGAWFDGIDPTTAKLQASGERATSLALFGSRARLSGLRVQIETIGTGGENITTPPASTPQVDLPSFTGFDRLQSFYADFEGRPTDHVTGTLSVNFLGHVPTNPIDQIFYESRGIDRSVLGPDYVAQTLRGERVAIHHATISWEDRQFQLEGFYRSGHYHWGYEGDFFGIYRDAYYGLNTDVYNADAPVGFEIAGKRRFDGLKLAYGEQLWWGANPTFVGKYRRAVGSVTATAIFQDDVAKARTANVQTAQALPVPMTRKLSVSLEHARGPLGFTLGGLWSGSPRVGEPFQFLKVENGDTVTYTDKIFKSDALGAKAKVTYQRGRLNAYAQAARMGLVADGGPTAAITYTGWTLKDVGTGNQDNFITGLLYNRGPWQLAPNILWQKPLIGPIPGSAPSPARPRNIEVYEDPFAVRANREMFGAEILIGYDPTPATWMWAWDNDIREDAPLAASLDFVYRHNVTTMDAATYVPKAVIGQPWTQTPQAFPGATPARDLWELRGRFLSRLNPVTRIAANAFVGDGEPNGENTRVVHRFGGDARVAYRQVSFWGSARFNDWGPYDYHRDFNLTFPAQYSGDVAYVLGSPRWLSTTPQTSVGFKGTYRTLDQYSPRWAPPVGSTANGSEWEFRTYLYFAL
jgi:beta-galactosidase